MNFTVGIAEIGTFMAALAGCGWLLIRMTYSQFEKRLDEKFATVNAILIDIRRLDVEVVRNDHRASQLYATKSELERVSERIFDVLQRVEASLGNKVSREEVDRLIESVSKTFRFEMPNSHNKSE